MASPRPARLDVVPVERLPAERLRELFDSEREAWRHRLGWECAASAPAMTRAVEWGVVRGAALLDGGDAVGMLVHQASASITRFCGAVLPPRHAHAAASLLDASLAAIPSHVRIEGQLTAFEAQEAVDAAFRERGFCVEPRDFLSLEGPLAGGDAPPGVALGQLDASDLTACGQLLVEAHAGSVEAVINDVFRTETAAVGYLRDLVDTRGCGTVDAQASAVARQRGRVIGLCVASWTSMATGHVPQIAVAPGAQGRGVGRLLLARAVERLRAGGAGRVTLSTTRSNVRASSWYAALGFRPLTTFAAYHRSTGPHDSRS